MTNDLENKINQALGKFLISNSPDNAIEFAKYLIKSIAEEKVQYRPESSTSVELELSLIEKIGLVLEDRKSKGAKLKQLVKLLGFSSRSSSRVVSAALSRRNDDCNIIQIPAKQGGVYYLNKYAPVVNERKREDKSSNRKKKIEGATASNEAMRFMLEKKIAITENDLKERLKKIGYNPKSAQYIIIRLSDPDQNLINWNRAEATINLTEKGKAYDPGPVPAQVKERLMM